MYPAAEEFEYNDGLSAQPVPEPGLPKQWPMWVNVLLGLIFLGMLAYQGWVTVSSNLGLRPFWKWLS